MYNPFSGKLLRNNLKGLYLEYLKKLFCQGGKNQNNCKNHLRCCIYRLFSYMGISYIEVILYH